MERWERVLHLHRLLSLQRYPNAARAGKELAVADRTIRRDIEWMKDAFRALYCIFRYGIFTPHSKLPAFSPLPKPYEQLAAELKAQTSEDLEHLFVNALCGETQLLS